MQLGAAALMEIIEGKEVAHAHIARELAWRERWDSDDRWTIIQVEHNLESITEELEDLREKYERMVKL